MNKPIPEIEEFREKFVKSANGSAYNEGWLVPYVDTSADHLETWLTQKLTEAREQGAKEFAITVLKELEMMYGKKPAIDFFKKLSVSLRTPLKQSQKESEENK